MSRRAAAGTPGTIVILCSGQCQGPRPRSGPQDAPRLGETEPTSLPLVVRTVVEERISGSPEAKVRHCLRESGFLQEGTFVLGFAE